MAARLIEVADALQERLAEILEQEAANDPEFGLDGAIIIPTRRWTTEYAISDLSTVKIDIQPIDCEPKLINRSGAEAWRFSLVVAVQKRLAAASATIVDDIDELVNLTTYLFNSWTIESALGVTGFEKCVCVERNLLAYSPEFLKTRSQYFGSASFVFWEPSA